MVKDQTYWTRHKEIYIEMYNNLDVEIARLIADDPSCEEARLLSEKVDEAIAKELGQ